MIKHLLISSFCCSFLLSEIHAQTNLGLEYQRTFEKMNLEDFDDVTLGNSAFLLTKQVNQHRFAYGMEIQEALFGEFGGLYVFGCVGEFDYKPKGFPITIHSNLFLGGGGGAGAPDGSGLAYRYALGFKKAIYSNMHLLARYSNYNFPTGKLRGEQIQLGFTYGLPSVFNQPLSQSRYSKQGFSVQGFLMNLDKDDAQRISSAYPTTLLAVEYTFGLYKSLDALLRLQAAVSPKIDGFMAYYSGLSSTLFRYRNIKWKLNGLIGSCGGGGVNTSGGLAYAIESGIEYSGSTKSYMLYRGYNQSNTGKFSADYYQLGIKYNFESTLLFATKGRPIRSVDEFTASQLNVSTGITLHKAPHAIDKNERFYEDMILMYFAISYPIHPAVELLGETRWAMGGDYGAYAEGIFGCSPKLFTHNQIDLSLPIQLVVAGGGGIDVGKGIGVQWNASLRYSYAKFASIALSLGKLKMIDGSYDPLSFQISFQQGLTFFKKHTK